MAWQLVFGTVKGVRKLDTDVWKAYPAIPAELVDWIDAFLIAVPTVDPLAGFYHAILCLPEMSHHLIIRLNQETSQEGPSRLTFHAIILTDAEIAEFGPERLSPADVILSLGYSGVWTVPSADPLNDFLTLQNIQLAGLKRRIYLPAQFWKQNIGNARRAAVLAPGPVAQSCWIFHALPGEFDVVKLFGESLLLHPNPWQITFATAFQPSDDIAAYAWRALPLGTSREQISPEDFPIIDLTVPSDELPLLEIFADQSEQGHRSTVNPEPVPVVLSKANVPPPTIAKKTSKAKRSSSASPQQKFDPTLPSLVQVRLQHEARIPLRAYVGTLVVLLIAGLIAGGYFGYKAYDRNQRQYYALQSLATWAALQEKLPPMTEVPIVKEDKLAEGADRQKLREFDEFLKSLAPKVPEKAAQGVALISKERKRFASPTEMKTILGSLMPGLQEVAKRNEIQHLLEVGDITSAATTDTQQFNRYLVLYNEMRTLEKIDVPALLHLAEALPENLPEPSQKAFGEFIGKMARGCMSYVDLTGGKKSADLVALQQLAEKATVLKLPHSDQIYGVIGELERRVQENEIKKAAEDRRRVIQATSEEIPIRLFDYKEAFLQEVKSGFSDRKYEILTDRTSAVFSKNRQPGAELKPVAQLADDLANVSGSFIVCLYDEKYNAPLIIGVVASADAPLELKASKTDLAYAEKSLRIAPSLLAVIARLEKSSSVQMISVLEVPPEIRSAQVSTSPTSPEIRPILVTQAGYILSDMSLRLQATQTMIQSLAVTSVNQRAAPILNFGTAILVDHPNPDLVGGESFEEYLKKLGKSDVVKNLELLPDYLKASVKNSAKAFPGVERQSNFTPMMNKLTGKAELGKRLRELRALAQQEPMGSRQDRQRMEPFCLGIKKVLTDDSIDALGQLAKPETIPIPADQTAALAAAKKALETLNRGFPLKILGQVGGGVIFQVVVAD